MPDMMVSVICNAYNQAPYIRACLEGIVMQRTSFPFEVLVHDDASTDGTADVIREFEARCPALIKPIYQTENQFSRGGISRFQYPRVTGRYIAYCEGDDYWTDPEKLEVQVRAMEAHPEADICAHAATKIDANTGQALCVIAPRQADALIPAEEVIAGGGQFVSTNAIMIRASLNERIPEFRRMLKLDFSLQIHGTLRGGMLYLARNMSVYRYRTPGSWTTRQREDIEFQRRNIANVTRMLRLLDAETGGRYHETIVRRSRIYERRLLDREFHYCLQHGDFRTALSEKYAENYRGLSLAKRCGTRLFAALPWAYGIYTRANAARHALRGGGGADCP